MTESIGQRIARLRKSKGLTQLQLAELVGMSQQAFASLEKKDTPPKRIYEISAALGVDVGYIYNGEQGNSSLSVVKESTSDSFTCDEIEEVIPVALERTIVALQKQFQAQNIGKLDIVKHQDIIASFLGASIAVELSGDYERIAKKFIELESIKA
ncbi:hypothetical protein BB427_11385 [Pseudoalteromonas sp. BMB]|uniref:helix-turn-helix transcriptional regulator n=1 Tax=Pseudoalteromonas sp. BMB TaxID=1874619 RepID=UPI00083D11D6|nr:helix-turn-helix transcriptional regulator [Pseudoalteromonas sp. BMB]ODB41087.1 hypothetical protein BB427_11385 [Pseudoalteromonas sp. BMB]